MHVGLHNKRILDFAGSVTDFGGSTACTDIIACVVVNVAGLIGPTRMAKVLEAGLARALRWPTLWYLQLVSVFWTGNSAPFVKRSTITLPLWLQEACRSPLAHDEMPVFAITLVGQSPTPSKYRIHASLSANRLNPHCGHWNPFFTILGLNGSVRLMNHQE